jgi:hypothetical protein
LGTAPKKLCYQTFPWLVLDKSAWLLNTNYELLAEFLLIYSLGGPKVKQDELVTPWVDSQVIIE